jgi:putative protease
MHREHIPCLRKTIQVNDRSSLGAQLESQYEKVGRIAHFYTKPSVAVVELSSTLNKGDKIVIKGSTTDIEQTVDSIEIEHKQIPSAQAGQSIGMKVNGRVRENDIVYRVKP